ncbi:MAG: hypothetical protein HOP11_02015 [Saprospiraceae bacterium]|nr:hypothetical protein [Saprospiraceae bacterium]
MMLKNQQLNFDFLAEWEKISQSGNIEEKAKKLSMLALIKKGAISHKYLGNPIQQPIGHIRLEYDKLLRMACQNSLDSLLFEYVRIALQKSQTIPVNLIVPLIEIADKNHDLAIPILDIFYEPEFFILSQNKEWEYLHPQTSILVSFSTVKKFAFLFALQLKKDPEKTFSVLLENVQQWNDKQLESLIPVIYSSKQFIPIERILDLHSQLKGKLKFKITGALLQYSDYQYSTSFHTSLLEILSNTKIDYQSTSHGLPGFEKMALHKALASIPPSLYSELPAFKKIVLELYNNNQLEILITSIHNFKDSISAFRLIKILIDESLFTEEIDVKNLTSCLDYNSFNKIAIYCCQTMKDKNDLEAFLHLINYFRHFWSDELLIEILNLHRHKSLLRKYHLDVFYEFIPYRINPLSKQESNVPQIIKDNISQPLSYTSILNFRKLLRK